MAYAGFKAYDCHFLASCFAEGLCPSNLARIALHPAESLEICQTEIQASLEIFVALGRAKAEDFGVVPDESGAMAWINTGRAEVAFFNTHGVSWETM